MRIKHPVELVYLMLMLRWERSAPPEKHQGVLDGKPERNSQMSRMAYVLQKIGTGDEERIFGTLARHSRREDGESYISRSASWMNEPYSLSGGWHFEGCCSLELKQSILQSLTKVGLSSEFVACVDDFVAGTSVEKYFPTDEEQEEIVRRIRVMEQQDRA